LALTAPADLEMPPVQNFVVQPNDMNEIVNETVGSRDATALHRWTLARKLHLRDS
jgi:hypothetical protein